MHIISQAQIRRAQAKWPDSSDELESWLRVTRKIHFENAADLKAVFSSVDKVGKYFVFNIGGYRLRLIAAIHFNTGKLFIRNILTHKEYGKDRWKK